MKRGSNARAVVLLLLWAGGLGSGLALFGLRPGRAAEGPEPASAPSGAAVSAAVAQRPAPRAARAPAEASVRLTRAEDPDEPGPAAGGGTPARLPFAIVEREFYEGFLRDARERPEELEERAAGILLGDGPDPEKVALLRALFDGGSERTEELFLLALHELPDESAPQGESVPSTALLLLERRAVRHPRSRTILKRAAFEPPHLPTNLRGRAAAGFFLRATRDELLASRAELAREQDPQVRACALEALSRNPNTDAAAALLAAHGREPAEAVADVEEPF